LQHAEQSRGRQKDSENSQAGCDRCHHGIPGERLLDLPPESSGPENDDSGVEAFELLPGRAFQCGRLAGRFDHQGDIAERYLRGGQEEIGRGSFV